MVVAPVSAQVDSLSAFIQHNPNAVDFNVLHEGTKINFSADEAHLLVNFSVAHPALQMRFLMQHSSIYIDPSGKKRRVYEVIMPSALDVKDELAHSKKTIMQEGFDGNQKNQSSNLKVQSTERPDLRPLILALNKRGASFRCGKDTIHLGYQHFYIEMDTKNEWLNFYALLPKDVLMRDKKLSDTWSVGIFSINGIADIPPSGGVDGKEVMTPPPLEGEDEESLKELMQRNIREWKKFSIDDVNNANIADAPKDTVAVRAYRKEDDVVVQVEVSKIENQLAFLMQGLDITVVQSDTLHLKFPSAPMVRSKIKRHPNEVKAELWSKFRNDAVGRDSINKVVRPDVQPLVAALNDTTATVTNANAAYSTKDFIINVNRETAIMTFTIRFPTHLISANKHLELILLSKPMSGGNLQEFTGRRLSDEKSPQPEGLGTGLRKENAAERTYQKTVKVKLTI